MEPKEFLELLDKKKEKHKEVLNTYIQEMRDANKERECILERDLKQIKIQGIFTLVIFSMLLLNSVLHLFGG